MSRHLLVIGAQRCGTTYLRTLLDAHPDITMARPARPEPKVFLSQELSAKGADWYRATYFAHATSEAVLGDKSTSYLEYADAADRAAAMLGSAEVLVLIRNPIDRAISNWRFSTENGLEQRPLDQALTENLNELGNGDRLTGTGRWDSCAVSVSPYAYVERGRYAMYLKPWFTRFSGSVHVRFFEELICSDTVLTGLYESLGVDPGFCPPELGEHINSSNQPAPELEPSLVNRLWEFFDDSDTALRSLLGRPLPWDPQRG